MSLEDNGYSISACRIKHVLNKNMGNVKSHVFRKFNKIITETTHYEIMNVKYKMCYKYKIALLL